MPYTRGYYKDKWRIERIATDVRERLALDQFEPLDPQLLADELPAHVFYPEEFGDADLARRLRTVKWDGFAFSVGDDETLMVLLNPARPPTRQTATLMEEFSHHILGHHPSKVERDPATGLMTRSFNQSQEHEAYDLGSAILLPKERIQRDVAAHYHASDIALVHNCSEELVTYRIKRMRLWNRYSGYAA